jgi:hypothetical protein
MGAGSFIILAKFPVIQASFPPLIWMTFNIMSLYTYTYLLIVSKECMCKLTNQKVNKNNNLGQVSRMYEGDAA